MATSHYKRPLRIRPIIRIQPTGPLDAKSIVAETLAVARECRRILQTHHAQEANMIGQVCALLDGLDLAVIRGLKGTE